MPYMKAWNEELANLATTRKELEIVDGNLWAIELDELGQEIADKNRVERRLLRIRGEKREK